MGPDFLPGRGNRRDPVDLLAVCCILIEEISFSERDLIRLLFCLLRTGTLSGNDDSLPRPAGFYRRGTHSSLLQCHPDLSAPIETARWHGIVRRYRDICSCYRTSRRRLAD